MTTGIGFPIHDLDDVEAPLLVFGGPYSNLQATRALRAKASELGISASRTICTGDVVAYCGDPVATVDEIRDWGVAVVMGNCEESLAAGSEDCGCGFEEGTACDLLSQQWYAYSAAQLDADRKAWMAALPKRIDFKVGGMRLSAVHGGSSAINRYLFASVSDDVLDAELDLAGVDGIVAGHCGLPFTRTLGERFWHNAGALGMPANDATTDTWYALIELESGRGLRISHHRLAYDYAAAARRMREQDLAEGYARALETGLWPSLDILPEVERLAMGQPILLPAVSVKALAGIP